MPLSTGNFSTYSFLFFLFGTDYLLLDLMCEVRTTCFQCQKALSLDYISLAFIHSLVRLVHLICNVVTNKIGCHLRTYTGQRHGGQIGNVNVFSSFD